MNFKSFKSELKSIKELLRGKTITVSIHGVSTEYYTLRSLGNRILEFESKGYSFSFFNNDHTKINVDSGINMAKAIKSFGTSV